MALKQIIHIGRVHLRQLLLTPTLYAFLCLLFVFFWHLNADARKLQAVTGLSLNAWGYTAGVFSDPLTVLVFALGAIALLSDLPLIRPNTVLESSRCSCAVWAGGRVLYVFGATLFYTLAMVMLCTLTSGGSLAVDAGWGKLLNTLANGYTFSEYSVPAKMSLCFTTEYDPIHALALSALMGWGAGFCAGMIMLAVSVWANRTLALFSGSVLAVLDYVTYEKLPYWVYRISPFSFMRLGIITQRDMPWYPTAAEAGVTLGGLILLLVPVVLLAAGRQRAGGNAWQREPI